MVDLDVESSGPVAAGWEALTAGAWEQARDCFDKALAEEVTPEALEGLGAAMFWLDDPRTIELRERAYRLYQEAGRRTAAARVATALVWDHVAFRGEDAVAKGWLERAGQLLDGLESTAEHGWLAIQGADFALLMEGDPARAEQLATQAVDIGRALGVSDVELVGRALQGVAMVTQGRVADGMARLDASATAAVSGDIGDVAWACYTCCYLLLACDLVRDFTRAAQWCEKASELCERWRFEGQLHICRLHYAGVLLDRGEWDAAETEMLSAAEGLEATRPAITAFAMLGLSELRRRQGRIDEAGTLADAAMPFPRAQLALAAVALDAGDPAQAAAGAERFLRQVPPADRAERVGGLEVLIHARCALGDAAGARAGLDELEETVVMLGTLPLRAAGDMARAATLLAEGDAGAARACAEDAVDSFERAGAPFGAAEARTLLAHVLAAGGDSEAAQREASVAALAFEHLGAVLQAQRARAVTARPPPAEGPSSSPLTSRELEVLRLVAEGKSNAEMAHVLVLSEHTVHRHVANILTKLGAPTRAAAIARASARGLL